MTNLISCIRAVVIYGKKLMSIVAFLTLSAFVMAEQHTPPIYQASTRISSEIERGEIERAIGSQVTLLVPEHESLAKTAQPTLYWVVSNAVQKASLILEYQGKVLWQSEMRNMKSGLQYFSLRDTHIKLQAGKRYRWIMRVEGENGGKTSEVRAAFNVIGGSESDSVSALAQQGIWYDAFDLLSRQITQRPQQLDLRRNRAALLRQVGLHDAAKLDEKRLPLGLKAQLSKPSYSGGENIQLRLSCEKPCFIRIMHTDAQGLRTQIFPNAWQARNQLASGENFTFPGPNAPLQLTVAPPFGKESLDVYASDVALPEIPSTVLKNGLGAPDLKQENAILKVLASRDQTQFNHLCLSFNTQ